MTSLHTTEPQQDIATQTDHVARPPLRDALRRQIGAALRSGLRPASYLGLVREAFLTSVHAATYPLGLLPPAPLRPDAPDPDALDPAARRPVMLVHGWVHNRTAFLLMQRGLRRAGLGPLHTFEYPSFSGDLDEIAHRLVPAVERLVHGADRGTCVLIGHSMGGLVARQYVQELGGHRFVDTVVTMGTPHRGTFSAYCGLGRPALQCRPGSPYLQRLERTAMPSDTKWISYYSDLDFMVTPAVSAKLTHPALDATNVRVRDVGHLSMLLSPSLLNDLVHRLNTRHAEDRPAAAAG
ncbi:MAG TPA: alpha/beta fold hydrolase [Euzebyales bacterium]|nr:alpha/beta fold hydrolase [Euzebyales bacterium]